MGLGGSFEGSEGPSESRGLFPQYNRVLYIISSSDAVSVSGILFLLLFD